MLTNADIKFILHMEREYASLSERWREAGPYSQEVANLHATFKSRDAQLGRAVAGGLFTRVLAQISGKENERGSASGVHTASQNGAQQ